MYLWAYVIYQNKTYLHWKALSLNFHKKIKAPEVTRRMFRRYQISRQVVCSISAVTIVMAALMRSCSYFKVITMGVYTLSLTYPHKVVMSGDLRGHGFVPPLPIHVSENVRSISLHTSRCQCRETSSCWKKMFGWRCSIWGMQSPLTCPNTICSAHFLQMFSIGHHYAS